MHGIQILELSTHLLQVDAHGLTLDCNGRAAHDVRNLPKSLRLLTRVAAASGAHPTASVVGSR